MLAPDSPETSCPLLIHIPEAQLRALALSHPYVIQSPIHVRTGLEALPYGALVLRSLSDHPRASGSTTSTYTRTPVPQ